MSEGGRAGRTAAGATTTRLWLAAPCLVLLALGFAWSCSGKPAAPEVVLYTSCDDYLLREIIPAFEKETGITVKLVGDTEATKTTGLVQRVIAESKNPRADVWWSNEPFGTMKLAEEGLLEPFKPEALKDFGGVWPEGYAAPDGTWYGFAVRARAMVYNTSRLSEKDLFRGLETLTDPRFKNRIGIARPQFGTTRGHMGAIAAHNGESRYRAWVTALLANGLRYFDGNSAVVRAVAQGEIDIGLTDTDDVLVGQREHWPVALVFETPERGQHGEALDSSGPLCIPNTVAILKNAPHAGAAQKLADFLLSAGTERVLALSESGNVPLRMNLRTELSGKIHDIPGVDSDPGFDRVFHAIPNAIAVFPN